MTLKAVTFEYANRLAEYVNYNHITREQIEKIVYGDGFYSMFYWCDDLED